MGEAVTFIRILEIVPAAGVTTLLVLAVWYLFTSRIPTPREYETMERLLENEKQRAAAERKRAERKEEEAREAHNRLDQLGDALPKLTEFVESIDRRLDVHGYPGHERKHWQWPWRRDRGGSL